MAASALASIAGLVAVLLAVAGAWMLLWRFILSNIPIAREIAGLPPLPGTAARKPDPPSPTTRPLRSRPSRRSASSRSSQPISVPIAAAAGGAVAAAATKVDDPDPFDLQEDYFDSDYPTTPTAAPAAAAAPRSIMKQRS